MSLFCRRFVDISAHADRLKRQHDEAAKEYTVRARGLSSDNHAVDTPQVPPSTKRGIVGKMLRAFVR